MSKKAVYYGRVSTEEQAFNGYSLDAQKERCIEWANKHDIEIVEFFEDKGKSGADYRKLKSLQALNKYIKKNRVDCLIAWKLDRISRNIVDFYSYTYRNITDLGMTLYSITDPVNDLTNANHSLLGCLIGVASDESKDTSIRTKEIMLHRVQEGYFLGKAPVGYLNKREGKHGVIVVDENKAKFVLKAFTLYATGLHTMKSVSNELYKMGFQDKKGNPYPIRKIEHMLKDVVYTGRIKYGKNEDGTDRIFPGVHDPIVPLSLFKKVEAMRRNDGKPCTKHTDKTYVKLIKCTCGGYITAYHAKGAHNSGDYIYYKCHNRKQIHKHIKGIKQETLDTVFSNIMSEIHIPKKVVELIKPKLVKYLDEIYSTENEVYNSNAKRLEELNILIRKANEERLLGKSPISYDDFSSQMLQWQEEKELRSENIKSVSRVNRSLYSNIDTLMKFLQNINNTYMQATVESKQRLLRMVFDKVTYDTETQELTVKLKPIFQALRLVKDNLELCSEKVTTLPKVSSMTVSEYLAKNIELSLKNKVTTLKNLAITKKESQNETLLKNGADSGIRTHA